MGSLDTFFDWLDDDDDDDDDHDDDDDDDIQIDQLFVLFLDLKLDIIIKSWWYIWQFGAI